VLETTAEQEPRALRYSNRLRSLCSRKGMQVSKQSFQAVETSFVSTGSGARKVDSRGAP
jgi:hypothetical protein